jgi:putative thioredoxin
MDQLIGAGKATPTPADLIKDSSDDAFEQDVLAASKQTPVIVDFWAPWCGPCKQLGPAIEKVVKEANGAVKLVKINIDEHPYFASQLRVQSIPAVFAFKGGRPVDAFLGALPESQIRAFVKKLGGAPAGPSPIEQALEQAAAAVAAEDYPTAQALYGQVLAHDKTNAKAAGGLAKAYVALGDLDAAQKLLDGLPAEAKRDADVEAALAALDLARQAPQAADVAPMLEKLAHDPKDHQTRLDLALALFAGGQQEAAIEQLLELFKRDRKWNDGAARAQLVKFFEALGNTHPLTVQGRKRLSSLMFA